MKQLKQIGVLRDRARFLVLEVSHSIYQFIGGENDSREAFKKSVSADII